MYINTVNAMVLFTRCPCLHRALIAAFDEEDGEAAKEVIDSKAVKNLDIDFARLAKQIKLPDSDAFDAAAAKLGAERSVVVEKEKKAAAKQRAEASSAMQPEEVTEEQKKLEESDDDEEDLC